MLDVELGIQASSGTVRQDIIERPKCRMRVRHPGCLTGEHLLERVGCQMWDLAFGVPRNEYLLEGAYVGYKVAMEPHAKLENHLINHLSAMSAPC
jgi:hypothetical protein